jgi:cellulose synthase/poly-beta-1,6-N-acetylglucosamine synthase-like glycosyltransferase
MLKFLLIFFIVIYVLGYFGKLFFFNWIKKVSNQPPGQDAYNSKKEGEVTINTNPQNSKIHNESNGEYVDFEEIK